MTRILKCTDAVSRAVICDLEGHRRRRTCQPVGCLKGYLNVSLPGVSQVEVFGSSAKIINTGIGGGRPRMGTFYGRLAGWGWNSNHDDDTPIVTCTTSDGDFSFTNPLNRLTDPLTGGGGYEGFVPFYVFKNYARAFVWLDYFLDNRASVGSNEAKEALSGDDWYKLTTPCYCWDSTVAYCGACGTFTNSTWDEFNASPPWVPWPRDGAEPLIIFGDTQYGRLYIGAALVIADIYFSADVLSPSDFPLIIPSIYEIKVSVSSGIESESIETDEPFNIADYIANGSGPPEGGSCCSETGWMHAQDKTHALEFVSNLTKSKSLSGPYSGGSFSEGIDSDSTETYTGFRGSPPTGYNCFDEGSDYSSTSSVPFAALQLLDVPT